MSNTARHHTTTQQPMGNTGSCSCANAAALSMQASSKAAEQRHTHVPCHSQQAPARLQFTQHETLPQVRQQLYSCATVITTCPWLQPAGVGCVATLMMGAMCRQCCAYASSAQPLTLKLTSGHTHSHPIRSQTGFSPSYPCCSAAHALVKHTRHSMADLGITPTQCCLLQTDCCKRTYCLRKHLAASQGHAPTPSTPPPNRPLCPCLDEACSSSAALLVCGL